MHSHRQQQGIGSLWMRDRAGGPPHPPFPEDWEGGLRRQSPPLLGGADLLFNMSVEEEEALGQALASLGCSGLGADAWPSGFGAGGGMPLSCSGLGASAWVVSEVQPQGALLQSWMTELTGVTEQHGTGATCRLGGDAAGGMAGRPRGRASAASATYTRKKRQKTLSVKVCGSDEATESEGGGWEPRAARSRRTSRGGGGKAASAKNKPEGEVEDKKGEEEEEEEKKEAGVPAAVKKSSRAYRSPSYRRLASPTSSLGGAGSPTPAAAAAAPDLPPRVQPALRQMLLDAWSARWEAARHALASLEEEPLPASALMQRAVELVAREGGRQPQNPADVAAATPGGGCQAGGATLAAAAAAEEELPVDADDLLVDVIIFSPGRSDLASDELLVLGSQMVSELRDAVSCVAEANLASEAAVKVEAEPSGPRGRRASNGGGSGGCAVAAAAGSRPGGPGGGGDGGGGGHCGRGSYLFFEGTFLNDMRAQGALDYSRPIIELCRCVRGCVHVHAGVGVGVGEGSQQVHGMDACLRVCVDGRVGVRSVRMSIPSMPIFCSPWFKV